MGPHFHESRNMSPVSRIATIATFAALLAPAAWSAGKASPEQQNHQRERAHCMSGKSQQDRATCLKEADAAYQESRRSGLGTQGDGRLSNNATDRCRAQPAADRAACVDRIVGAGTSEGSVKGGGMIRRTETRTP
jgi:hypothetical protein